MSYHSQAQTQQRSAGFLAVVAFHVIAALGLFYGFTIQTIPTSDDPLKVNNIIDHPAPPVPIDIPIIDASKISITEKPAPVLPPIEVTAPPPITNNPITTGEPVGITQFTKPSILKATKPEYPSTSTRLGEEGTTTLSLFINENGHVTQARVAKSSGFERLDQAAVKHAIRNWVFTPCTQDNKVASCWHSTNLVWKIENAQH